LKSGQSEPIRKEYLELMIEIAYSGRMVNNLDLRLIENISNEILWEHAFSAVSGEK